MQKAAVSIAGALVAVGLTACSSQEEQLTYQVWVNAPAEYLAELEPAQQEALCQYPKATANYLYDYYDKLGSIDNAAIDQMAIQDALWEGTFKACGQPVPEMRR